MQNITNTRLNLRKMFNMQIGLLICTILNLFPFISGIAAIATLIMSVIYLIALYNVGKDISGCHTAFVLNIVTIILNVFSAVTSSLAVFPIVFSILAGISSIGSIYFICTSLSEFLNVHSFSDEARFGSITWIVYIVCSIINIVIGVLSYAIFTNTGLLVILTLVSTVSQLCSLVFFLLFLSKVCEAVNTL